MSSRDPIDRVPRGGEGLSPQLIASPWGNRCYMPLLFSDAFSITTKLCQGESPLAIALSSYSTSKSQEIGHGEVLLLSTRQ